MKQYLSWYLVLLCGCTVTGGDKNKTKVKHPKPGYDRHFGGDYNKEHASQYGEVYVGNYKINNWGNVWHNYSQYDICMMGRSARNGYNLQEHHDLYHHAAQSASMESNGRQMLPGPHNPCDANVSDATDYIGMQSTREDNSYSTITDIIRNLHHTSAHNAYYHLLRMVVYGELSQSDIMSAFGEVASENHEKHLCPNYLSALSELQQQELDNAMLPYGCHLAWAHNVLHDLKKTDTYLQVHHYPSLANDIYQLHAIVRMCPFGALPSYTRSHTDTCVFVPTYAACVMDDVIANIHVFPFDHMYSSIMHRVISGDIPKHVVLKSFSRVACAQGQNTSFNPDAQLTVAQLNAYRYIKNISLKNGIQ